MSESIDHGKTFDWGRAAADYARYRDIYPHEIYDRLFAAGIGREGQAVLDLGTGTGVLPRNMYGSGANFTGVDSSAEQIREAERLSAGTSIRYLVGAAEEVDFPPASVDAVTACQCFFYFDHRILAPRLARMLKSGGRLAVVYMAWLPDEDPIAGESERLVLSYNPDWSGKGETRRPVDIPAEYDGAFVREQEAVFDLRVPFTRENWAGRIRACRGVGASLSEEQARRFDEEHRALLDRMAPPSFSILHYAAMTVLRRIGGYDREERTDL